MTRLIYPAALGLALFSGQTLSTDYAHGKMVRVEASTSLAMETERSMERDGEPVDSRFGANSTTAETRSVVMIDEVLDHEDGRPTRLRREFEAVEASTVGSFGDQEMENDREGPLHEVTLELTLKDGDVIAEVVDGVAPDDDAALEGHLLPLCLDALLPEDEVDPDDSWEVDGDMLMRAIGLDIESALFPRPQREEADSGGEGRGGRGGRGGRRGGGRGAGMRGFFAEGDWDGKATLEADTEDWDGVECLVITIEAECDGELPEPEMGGGRGGRGGGGGAAASPSVYAIPENSFEIELEGKLLFSVADKRPVYFEIEGTVSTESLREMERRESVMVITTTGEGTFKHTVEIRVAGADDE